jgi:hypothetical protein
MVSFQDDHPTDRRRPCLHHTTCPAREPWWAHGIAFGDLLEPKHVPWILLQLNHRLLHCLYTDTRWDQLKAVCHGSGSIAHHTAWIPTPCRQDSTDHPALVDKRHHPPANLPQSQSQHRCQVALPAIRDPPSCRRVALAPRRRVRSCHYTCDATHTDTDTDTHTQSRVRQPS